MLSPKKVKYRKKQRGRMKGTARRGRWAAEDEMLDSDVFVIQVPGSTLRMPRWRARQA